MTGGPIGSAVGALTAAAGDARYAKRSNNLSDLSSESSARTSLGLGNSAVMSTAQIAADSALTGTYARPVNNTIVLLGNSRIARDLPGVQQCGKAGVFTWANAIAGGRFNVLNYAGVSGDTLAQIIARFATAVTPYAPAWVYIADPVNDATQNRTTAQMIADMTTLIGLVTSIRARAIIPTASPNNAHTTPQRAALLGFNRWVKQINNPFVVPVDISTVITDPSTGNWLSGTTYSTDGLHQTPAGAVRQAKVLATVLTSLAPPRDLFPSGPADPFNAVLNPLISGTPGSGFPTNWTTSGTSTFNTVARTDGLPGNWLEIDNTAGTADTYARQNQTSLPSGFAVGTVVKLVTEVQFKALTAITQFECNLQLRDGSAATVAQLAGIANNDAGAFVVSEITLDQTLVFQSAPFAIPATVAQLNLLNHFSAQGKVWFGRSALIQP